MKSTKSLPFLLTKVPSLTLHFILGLVGVGLGEREWRVSGRRKGPFEWEDRLVPAPFLYPNA